ncbi:MAG: homoserine kinase [Bacilli bacterium]|nr:homoserine kinase [Bacilli bacterium]
MENKVFKISIPLSSANLGCGFDSLAIALSLYNTYTFTKSSEFSLSGFKKAYANKNNLCLQSYLKTFEKLGLEPVKVNIDIKQDIPNCGGLGSSANVIIAGVMAANYFSGKGLSINELAKIACELEGHPDNVIAEMFGGITSAVKEDGEYKYFKYDVSNDLIFTILVPSFSLNTKEMRQCLPKEVKLEDAVYNLSRALNTVNAFQKGDFESLKFLLKDKLHEQYRISKIENAQEIKEEVIKDGNFLLISGSGASLLIISKEEVSKNYNGFEKYSLKVCNEGMRYE